MHHYQWVGAGKSPPKKKKGFIWYQLNQHWYDFVNQVSSSVGASAGAPYEPSKKQFAVAVLNLCLLCKSLLYSPVESTVVVKRWSYGFHLVRVRTETHQTGDPQSGTLGTLGESVSACRPGLCDVSPTISILSLSLFLSAIRQWEKTL